MIAYQGLGRQVVMLSRTDGGVDILVFEEDGTTYSTIRQSLAIAKRFAMQLCGLYPVSSHATLLG